MPSLKIPKTNPLAYAQAALAAAELTVTEVREIAHGWQLKGANGGSVNVYRTGSVVPQGSGASAVVAAFAAYAEKSLPLEAVARPAKLVPKPPRAAAVAAIPASFEPINPRTRTTNTMMAKTRLGETISLCAALGWSAP